MPVQPPTSRQLLTELVKFVRDTVKGYPFPDPSGAWLDCRVYLHGLPEEQEDGIYPFVLVRWAEGEVQSDQDARTSLRDNVILALGVHAPRSQAEAGLLCAELMDVLRRALWKKRILSGRFELVEPLKSAMPGIQQQVHRFHMATIETVWDYVWPPKALEEAGESQNRNINGVNAYSVPQLEGAGILNEVLS